MSHKTSTTRPSYSSKPKKTAISASKMEIIVSPYRFSSTAAITPSSFVLLLAADRLVAGGGKCGLAILAVLFGHGTITSIVGGGLIPWWWSGSRGNVCSDRSTRRNIRHRARFVAGIGTRVDAPISARVGTHIVACIGTLVGCARLVAPAALGPGGQTLQWEKDFHHRHKTIFGTKITFAHQTQRARRREL
jgi:hypothetical protein